jgi:hypothetical protein
MVRWNKSKTYKAPAGEQNVVIINDKGVTGTRPFVDASGVSTINENEGPDIDILGGLGIEIETTGEDEITITNTEIYTDTDARAAVKYQPDKTLAGATPVNADVATWANGDRGIGIGTDSTVWLMARYNDVVYFTQLEALPL